ncbi:E3 ubiquitin-protein ligase SINA-like 10 [Triticum aestivum]|uniref:E3 ubiquitin-protein ligase SINA-like 10 n=1 Tax=Triticum aestivum TaxID=4565 RepID=UPI001D025C5C|nr:E3 ubiquitin-protein ligase SINA-like 10 [Triticum aestivum]
MEKTVTKAERRHGRSTSASTELISVDVDRKVLGCPRCLRPFLPPVFQCAAGHLICSTCHGDLPDKGKCVSCFINTGYTRCFIPTSYSRCHAVDHIVRSVHVACLYTVYGCTAKILYHEKAEHEKTCPNMYGFGGLPGRVVKMGPCGGAGGDARDMNPRFVDRITNVILRHGAAIYAIAVLVQEDEHLIRNTGHDTTTVVNEKIEIYFGILDVGQSSNLLLGATFS